MNSSVVVGEPVFKVVNYSAAGGHTCLDADGNNIAQGGAVTSYGCDPNQFNQTNQLWIVAGSTSDPADWHLTADPSTGDLIQDPFGAIGSQLSANSAVGKYSLINLASVVNNGMEMYDALTLSSLDTPDLDGQNSQSVLYSPVSWPATSGTALYGFKMTD